jgi:hypothetical protein
MFKLFAADPTPRHRVWACELVDRYGGEAQRETLTSLLDDPDGHVRKAAEEAMTRLS